MKNKICTTAAFEHPKEKMLPLEKEFSDAIAQVKVLSSITLSKEEVEASVSFFFDLERISLLQYSISHTEDMLRKLSAFKDTLDSQHSTKLHYKQIAESIIFLQGFLKGRLLEKMNTVDQVNIHRGFFGVQIAHLLKALHIPDHFSR